MKIDTGSPRIPLHRLKHPLREKSPLPEAENSPAASDEPTFSDDFERDILEAGAERFKKWLEKLQIK